MIDLILNTKRLRKSISSPNLIVGEYSHPNFWATPVKFFGLASKNNQTKTFNWSFKLESHDILTRGVVESHESTFEVVMQAHHLFFNDLVTKESLCKFQALADAGENTNGDISQVKPEELDTGSDDSRNSGKTNNLWI